MSWKKNISGCYGCQEEFADTKGVVDNQYRTFLFQTKYSE